MFGSMIPPSANKRMHNMDTKEGFVNKTSSRLTSYETLYDWENLKTMKKCFQTALKGHNCQLTDGSCQVQCGFLK